MGHSQHGVTPGSGRGWSFVGGATASAVPFPTPLRGGAWLFCSVPLWGDLGFGSPAPLWGGLGIGYPVPLRGGLGIGYPIPLWGGLWCRYSCPLWDGDWSLGDTPDLLGAGVLLAR